MKGSKRPKVLPKRQRERSGEEKKEEKDRTDSAVKTLCTSQVQDLLFLDITSFVNGFEDCR